MKCNYAKHFLLNTNVVSCLKRAIWIHCFTASELFYKLDDKKFQFKKRARIKSEKYVNKLEIKKYGKKLTVYYLKTRRL